MSTQNNTFNNIFADTFSRRWGGTGANAVDPYISGYFFTHWDVIPSGLTSYIDTFPAEIKELSNIKAALESSCLSVNVPGGTVNKTEMNGLGNSKWSAVTNVEYDTTATFKFLEFAGLPLLNIIHAWVQFMRDYKLGVAPTASAGGNKSNYTGSCYYWTTRPDGKTVEYASYLTGLFPMRDPLDLFSSDITAYDRLEIDLDFNVDYNYTEKWVRTKCETLSTTMFDNAQTAHANYVKGK